MSRISFVLVIVAVGLGLGGGLIGCGPNKSAGPTDLEQEKKFIERGQGMKPGPGGLAKKNDKAKAAPEENKAKTNAAKQAEEKAKAVEDKREN